jgi:hypothetical protein
MHACLQVEIGAFRTYPEGYKPPDEGPSEYQTIPLSKIEDFGVHAKQVRVVKTCITADNTFRLRQVAHKFGLPCLAKLGVLDQIHVQSIGHYGIHLTCNLFLQTVWELSAVLRPTCVPSHAGVIVTLRSTTA